MKGGPPNVIETPAPSKRFLEPGETFSSPKPADQAARVAESLPPCGSRGRIIFWPGGDPGMGQSNPPHGLSFQLPASSLRPRPENPSFPQRSHRITVSVNWSQVLRTAASIFNDWIGSIATLAALVYLILAANSLLERWG